MQYIITPPGPINCTVELPASKSISNRALIINALANRETNDYSMLRNLSDCDDTEVILDALNDNPEVIDIRAAGTAMRFMTAYLAATPGTHTLTGTTRMKQRPIKALVDALRYMNANIQYLDREGFPPLLISGTELNGGYLEVPGNISSQYISALLMIGPVMKKGLTLRLTGDIISRPYIDLTLNTMREFGADAEWVDIDIIKVTTKPYERKLYYIENDWSAASYWYEIMALSENEEDTIRLTGLNDSSRQGDSITRYIFSLLGVKTTFEQRRPGQPQVVRLTKYQREPGRLEYDFVNAPDLAQTFVVTCALKNIHFRFTGLKTLKIKETDRMEAIKKEMKKMGYLIRSVNDEELLWDGEMCEPEDDLEFETYEDHRMAMAFAPAAIKKGNLLINNPRVVTKSYPGFWEDLKTAGFGLHVIEQ